ncbi:hypothetical protein ACFQU2_26945 [Siccirubricoccus deserti]
MTTRRLLLGAAAALPLGRTTRAAVWPDRPLTMLVAFAAGGRTDLAARTLARFLEKDLGQPVVVVNRPGAGGGSASLNSPAPSPTARPSASSTRRISSPCRSSGAPASGWRISARSPTSSTIPAPST